MIGVCSAPPCGALDRFRKFGLGRLAIKCILTILIVVRCWKLERKILFSKFLQTDKRFGLLVLSSTFKTPHRRYSYIDEGLSFKSLEW